MVTPVPARYVGGMTSDAELHRIVRNLVKGLGALLLEHPELVAEYAVAAMRHEGGDTGPASAPAKPAGPGTPDQYYKGGRNLMRLHYPDEADPVEVMGDLVLMRIEAGTGAHQGHWASVLQFKADVPRHGLPSILTFEFFSTDPRFVLRDKLTRVPYRVEFIPQTAG